MLPANRNQPMRENLANQNFMQLKGVGENTPNILMLRHSPAT